MITKAAAIFFLALCCGRAIAAQTPGAVTTMRFLYPTLSGTFAASWIAKEAGYFSAEGLDIELIRVGGSSRIVAAMLGGTAPIIHAGAPASMARHGGGQRLRYNRVYE